MLTSVDFAGGGNSEAHWKSLHYFNLYRCAVAALLFLSSLQHPSPLSFFNPDSENAHFVVVTLYLLFTGLELIGLYGSRSRFNLQLSLQVFSDVLALTLLMHFSGGVVGSLGIMLLVSLTGAGLVGQGRLGLFYAALATIFVLGEQILRALAGSGDAGGFLQTGLFCVGFFAVAASARLLARRVIANEELARQRGIDLQNQLLINQRVIEEMQDGVLVLNQQGWVKQHNPQAERLLGLLDAPESLLAGYSDELAQSYFAWQSGALVETVPDFLSKNGRQLRPRFVSIEGSGHDALAFLEDVGRLQAQAQQLKLAALGRLTANIAHEIRNPLSAISHAGELLLEERRGAMHDRLLRIVLDNAQRLERIVQDVLELGRRDRAHRELIRLADTLPLFMEEFVLKEKIASEILEVECAADAGICFDRSHFHQVLWNLLGNALRHSRREAGSVVLLVRAGRRPGEIELHVMDDGEGVAEESREQIFEPFFTTHNRGTGLGLYIARELCAANEARLELLRGEGLRLGLSGAHFCITGGSSGCR